MPQGRTNNVSLPKAVLPAGAKLGKYEIVERLGSGGQSVVYKGYDPLLDRHVAIKQVAPQLAADEKFTERFRDMARQLARLACEQIVTLYELIEQEEGLFVVMEFVEGHTIETTLAGQPGPVESKAVLRILWRIAAGLSALHRAGIVHRDIKPGNIIVGEGLRVKITDFGVAAKIGSPASMRLGTTKYMAPELFSGDSADGRADIYSLGMIGYEMLTGRAKFNEVFHDVVRDPHSEALRWMKWHSSPEPVPLLAEVNPAVPVPLAAIVEKMLAKDPCQRFANVEELGREMRASFSPRHTRPAAGPVRRRRAAGAAAGAAQGPAGGLLAEEGDELTVAPTVQPGGPATAEIPKEPMSLRRKLTLAGVAAGVLLAGLVTYLVVEDSRQQTIRKRAAVAYDEAYGLYKEAGKSSRTAEKTEAYQAALERFREVIEGYNKTNYARRGEVMGYLCRAYLSILGEKYEDMNEEIRTAEQYINRIEISGADKEFVPQAKQEVGDLRAYYQESKQFTEAIKRARDAEAKADFDTADRILLTEASKYANQSDREAVVQEMRQSIAEKKKHGQYVAQMKQGDELAAKNKTDEAKAAYARAIQIIEQSKDTMPSRVYEELKQAAQDKITTLDREAQYAVAMADAAKALNAKSRLAAADAYKRALKVKPDDPDGLRAKIRDLEHDHWLEQGRKDLEANNLDAAEKALQQAKQAKDSPEVEKELTKVGNLRNYQGLVQQGNRLFGQKQYEAALEKYAAASRLSTDRELQSRMADCNYFINLNKAQEHRTKKEWGQALNYLARAKQVKPAAGAEVDALVELVKQEQAYTEKMDAAEKARQKRSWAEALARAEEAKKIRATADADKLIAQIRYDQHLEMGRTAMGEENFVAAKAYFELAKRFQSTAEVEDLIRQCEDKLKEKSGS